MASVRLYVTYGCRYCMKAKQVLQQARVPYTEYNVVDQPERLAELRAVCETSSVPQALWQDEVLGGADDLQFLAESGKLEEIGDEIRATMAATPCGSDDETQQGIGKGEDIAVAGGDAEEVTVASFPTGSAQDSLSPRRLPQDRPVNVYPGFDDPAEVECLVARMRDPATGIDITDRRHWLKSVPRCFVASEAVVWMQRQLGVGRDSALDLAQRLVHAKVIHRVVGGSDADTFVDRDDHWYRFQEDSASSVLNMRVVWHAAPRPASSVVAELTQAFLALLDAFMYVGEQGSVHLNLSDLQSSDVFAAYAVLTPQLQALDPTHLSEDERRALFINLYNGLVVHASVMLGVPVGHIERSRFFSSASYNVGGHVLSLNDIEHGVLRNNAYPPYSLWPVWKESDARMALRVPLDPRIHFALNCGARSCPPMRVYHVDRLDEDLTAAAESFCQSVRLDQETRVVRVSKLLYWYVSDFGGNEKAMIRRVCTWLPEKLAQSILALLESGTLLVTYDPYDWGSITVPEDTSA